MATGPFKIYVMGDAGEDIYSWAEEGARSARPAVQDLPADQVRDIAVPSGAGFIAAALSKFFPDQDVGGNPKPIVVALNHLQAQKPTINGGSVADDALLPARPLDRILTQLTGYKVGDRTVDRVNRFMILHRINEKQILPSIPAKFQSEGKINWIAFSDLNVTERNFLVFHHGASAWDDEHLPPAHQPAINKIESWINHFKESDDSEARLQILVNIKQLPMIETWGGTPGETPNFKSKFWQALFAVKDRVGIVISLSALRRAGAAIPYGRSLEQTVEGFCSELRSFSLLRALSPFHSFRDLFVRVDSVGIIHIYRDKDGKENGELHFEAFTKDRKRRDPDVDGRIVGKNTLLLTSLALHVWEPGDNSPDAIRRAIRAGLKAGIEIYDSGYVRQEFLDDGPRINRWITRAENVIRNPDGAKPDFVVEEIPEEVLQGRREEPWQILRTGHTQENASCGVIDGDPKFAVSLINLALAIVDVGPYSILNRKLDESHRHIWKILERGAKTTSSAGRSFRVNAPIVRFNKLIVVDRKEAEELSSIKDLLSRYIADRAHSDKPISIAVFAPPGTGKSFAVKQIAEAIDSERKSIEAMEYNIAQFKTPDDLGNALHRAGSINNAGKTPLVFFDEFDCSLDKEALGWLKFFLAPMQDGSFYGAAGTINIGRAIFVFAGGASSCFSEFKKNAMEFKDQKGPDFISRLRGYIDIPTINKLDHQEQKDVGIHSEEKVLIPVIRRAVILRTALEKYHFTRKTQGGEERAMIDEPVAYALLTVDGYRHGVRSIEAILQMCSPIDGWVRAGSLPSRSQLAMHIDADDFYHKIYQRRVLHYPIPAEVQADVDRSKDRRRSEAQEAKKRLSEIVAELKEFMEDPQLSIKKDWRSEMKSKINLLDSTQ